jgi:hypothetical protein
MTFSAVRLTVPDIQLVVTMPTKYSQDEEAFRLFGIYEASSAKEHVAASRLLNKRDVLSHPAYSKLLHNLQAMRTVCNANMLAIAAHHKKMQELLTAH